MHVHAPLPTTHVNTLYSLFQPGCHIYNSTILAYIDDGILRWPSAGECFVNFTLFICDDQNLNCLEQTTLTVGNVAGEFCYA